MDREKLDKTLDHAERQKVLEEITVHMETLETLVKSGEFDIFCDDYLNHNGLGVCEAFALQADLLNLTQQLPGVLNAHGLKSPGMLSRLLKQGLRKNPLIDVLADGANTNNELPPLLTQLKALAADIADPNLGGELRVMHRGEVDLTRYSIVGVHGEGIAFGLTDADRQSEALTRRNDYLFADRTDATGKRVASTSPSRLVDESGETLVKAAAHTWVFVLPVDHPEARKFSALKIDWASKAKAFADGPGVSRVLVGLAAYNLVSEMWSVKQLKLGES